MGKASAAVVRQGLKVYAERGIFRDFSEQKGKNGNIKFGFLVFDENRVTLEFAEQDHTLVIRDMLKHVPADMYADLQSFVQKLSDPGLPAHRRINRSSADVQFVKKRGNVSLVLRVKRNRYKYGVEKLIGLVSWVRTHLQQWHPEYLWQVMGEPEG